MLVDEGTAQVNYHAGTEIGEFLFLISVNTRCLYCVLILSQKHKYR